MQNPLQSYSISNCNAKKCTTVDQKKDYHKTTKIAKEKQIFQRILLVKILSETDIKLINQRKWIMISKLHNISLVKTQLVLAYIITANRFA